MQIRTILGTIAVASFALGFTVTLLSAPARFDYLVREDFFAGFGGNSEALQRGMQKAEAALAENPEHAEALVWHGAGLYFQAGQAFRKQDFQTGQSLAAKGLAEMDKAVQLQPEHVGVRIPRGSVLLTSARFMPPDMATPLIKRGIEDYEACLKLQAMYLDTMATHPKGELLQGLADGYSRLGETSKAEEFYLRITKELPDSAYAKRAGEWMKTKAPLPAGQAGCIGCHNNK